MIDLSAGVFRSRIDPETISQRRRAGVRGVGADPLD
jgi:hypothetical protein